MKLCKDCKLKRIPKSKERCQNCEKKGMDNNESNLKRLARLEAIRVWDWRS